MASAQENVALYDKTGEQHYDIISAFIKSISIILARMEGGEVK